MTGNTLRDSLVAEVRVRNNPGKQLSKAEPKLAKAPGRNKLRQAIANHLVETKGQITLPDLIELLNGKPRGKHRGGKAGSIENGPEMLQEDLDPAVMDACLTAVLAWAEVLEPTNIATRPAAMVETDEADDDFEDDEDDEHDAGPVRSSEPERMGALARSARRRAKH